MNCKDIKGRFIIAIPLYVNNITSDILEKRFEIARQLYNCFLGECKKRKRIYQDKSSKKQADAVFKLSKKIENKIEITKNKIEIDKLKEQSKNYKNKANELYRSAEKSSGYYLRSSSKNEQTNSLESFAADISKNAKWFSQHIDSHCRNKLMERSYNACKKSRKQKTKLKFKIFNKDFVHSVEGKSKSSALTIKKIGDNLVVFWLGLQIPANIDSKDVKFLQALKIIDRKEFSYIRLKWKYVGYKRIYFVDLVCLGKPETKSNHILKTGIVGLDIGPSTVAIVTDDYVRLREIYEINKNNTYKKLCSKEKKLSRKISRQQKANNPDNYNPDGTSKKNVKWVKSKRQYKGIRQLANLRRRIAESRLHSQRRLAWKLRSKGHIIRLDNDSYKNWQKSRYGKSIGKNAPGQFVKVLKQVFENTCGKVEELNTFITKSSQRCVCNNIEKKGLTTGENNLKIRIHKCSKCGLFTQRDICSALCNKFWDNKKQLVDTDKAKAFIMDKRPILRAGIEQVIQSSREGNFLIPSSFGTIPELEEIARYGHTLKDDAILDDDVLLC